MICKICGTELNGAAKCPVCGNPSEQASLEGPIGNENIAAVANAPVAAAAVAAPVYASAPAKKPRNKKVIAIVIAAIVLVIGIAGAVVAMVLGGAFKSDINKVFNAARKTIFDSSSMTFEIKVAGDTADGKLVIGEGLSDTQFNLEVAGEAAGLTGGEVYTPYNGTVDIEKGLDSYTDLADEHGLDIDAVDIVDTLLDKKIDEKALANLYDETLKPWIEETLEEEYDKSITLPTYDRTMEIIEEFLDYCVEEEAIKIEKSKAEKGKLYTIDVNTDKVLECFVDFCENTSELNEIMKEFDLYEPLERALEGEYEDIEISVVVDKKGYLAEVEAEMYDEKVRVTFTDINKTEITDEDIEEMEDSAEKEHSTYSYDDDYYEDDYYEDDYYDDDVGDYYDDVRAYCYDCGGAIYYDDYYEVDEWGDYYHDYCYDEVYGYEDYDDDYDYDVYEYCWYCDGPIYYGDEYDYDYTIDSDGDYIHMDCYNELYN